MRKVKIVGIGLKAIDWNEQFVVCPLSLSAPADVDILSCRTTCAWFRTMHTSRKHCETTGDPNEELTACYCGDKLIGELCQ